MRTSRSIKNIIAKFLGAFWILDGLLQFQPKMFSSDFVSGVLVPNLNGQPFFLHGIIAFGIFLWNLNPPLLNTLAALIQVAIGILLFFPPSDKKFRIGLYISIFWGLVVWLFGEGAGDLLTGSSSIYTGAPGSVFMYVVISVFLLVSERIKLTLLPKITAWVLILGAILQLQPSLWTSGGVQESLMAGTMESVHVLATFPTYISNLLSVNPIVGNWILVLFAFVIGIALLFRPNRITGTIAFIFIFLIWWLGQDFGMLTTLIAGTTTDPNTAPLLALLILPLFFDYSQQTGGI